MMNAARDEGSEIRCAVGCVGTEPERDAQAKSGRVAMDMPSPFPARGIRVDFMVSAFLKSLPVRKPGSALGAPSRALSFQAACLWGDELGRLSM
jgi:hypothetical protein